VCFENHESKPVDIVDFLLEKKNRKIKKIKKKLTSCVVSAGAQKFLYIIYDM